MAGLSLDWFQFAVLAAALQGALLTGVLLTQRGNRTANRLLGALMGTFTIYLASGVYFEAGLVRAFPHFFGVGYPTTWLFGPLVYLYARAASDRSWTVGRKELLHFLPLLVVIVVAFPYYATSAANKVELFERFTSAGMPTRLMVLEPTKYLSGIGYTIATAMYLRVHRRRIRDSYSNTARINLSWLLWLAGAAGATWLMATVLNVVDVDNSISERFVLVAITVLVYAIGYKGLRQPEVFRYETAEHPIPRAALAAAAAAAAPAPASVPEESDSRYERSGLNDIEAGHLKKSLIEVMEKEQPWRDSDLTLADLAARLDTTPHKLSEVLNSAVGQTFYDFVNAYRVKEVQRRIQAGDASRLKMLALAMDAGFASKSTFNQAFKKHTNQTPTDFRDAVGAA